MSEQLKNPNAISRFRHLGNIAVAGGSGILTFEGLNTVAENTPLPIVLGAIAAASIYRLMKRLS